MAVPNDRTVVYGTHVVPQEAIVREEGATTYKLDSTIAKRFGGKGSVDITSDQGDDGWVSSVIYAILYGLHYKGNLTEHSEKLLQIEQK